MMCMMEQPPWLHVDTRLESSLFSCRFVSVGACGVSEKMVWMGVVGAQMELLREAKLVSARCCLVPRASCLVPPASFLVPALCLHCMLRYTPLLALALARS